MHEDGYYIVLVKSYDFYTVVYFIRVEDMLRWVSGVNNNLPQMHMQERPLDRLPEIPGIITIFIYL